MAQKDTTNKPHHAIDEHLQIVDEETGEPTGITAHRSEVIQNKYWCRSTNVFVLNPEGEILCHQRSLHKERYPGVWSTHFGGHVSSEETFKLNALKELEEEIGLRVNHYQLIPWRTSKIMIQRLWCRDYLTIYNGDPKTLKIQESEIQAIEWLSPERIMEELQAEGENLDAEGKQWIAGTHNFHTDYQCMRAVLTAVLDAGLFGSDFYKLHKWMPPVI